MGYCEDCKQSKDTVKLCNGDLRLCKECNKIRFPPVKTSLAHALLAASPLKKMKPSSEPDEHDEQVIVPLPSPIAGPSNAASNIIDDNDVTVTAPRISCVPGCNNVTEKAKPVECLLCSAQFHKTCMGLKPSARPTAWICVSCKNIPRTLNLLTKQARQHEKEISDLKNENATLSQLVNEQQAKIEELKSNNQHTDTATKTNPSKNNDRAGTLIIGDSVIKDINESGLESTTVRCLKGARIEDIATELETPENYEAIIVHGGTNDCTNDEDTEVAKTALNTMIEEIREKAPDTTIFLSTICPRTDEDGKHQKRVDDMNSHIRSLADRSDKCELIDNDNNFRLRNNDADENALNGSKLHLSKVGTRRLLANFNAKRRVVRSRPTSTYKSTPTSESKHAKRVSNNDDKRSYQDNRGRGRGCYNCGERNHQKKNCKHGRPVRCFACGELGHKKHMDLCNRK